jgi:predicted Zn-dependent peptidase
MIKTRTKASLIRGLAENSGLAQQLAFYQTRYGDWRELFTSVDRIDKVTKADIRRVANETFVDNNRTVGVIETAGGGAPGSGDSGPGGAGSADRDADQSAANQGGAQ